MNRLKPFIASFLLLVMLVTQSSIAFAEEVDVDHDGEGDFIEMKDGEKAPFDGYLLHKDAMVKLITDKQHEIDTLKLNFDTEIGKLKLNWEADIKKKDTEINVNKEMYEGILKVRQDRIDVLVKEQWISDFKLVLGFALGFASSIVLLDIAVKAIK